MPAGDPPDALMPEHQIFDGIGEFTNMVCGAWLTGFSDQQSFALRDDVRKRRRHRMLRHALRRSRASLYPRSYAPIARKPTMIIPSAMPAMIPIANSNIVFPLSLALWRLVWRALEQTSCHGARFPGRMAPSRA